MYGNIKKIIAQLPSLKNNTLTMITLPTPKQEQMAFILAKKNPTYKILCIGASLAMVSGNEEEVPKFLSHFEFLWRLRKDTRRRFNRLAVTTLNYIIAICLGLTKTLKVKFVK